MCARLSVFPCVCVHTRMWMSVYILTRVFVSETMYVLMCLYVHACPCLYLFVCMSVCYIHVCIPDVWQDVLKT